MISTARSSTRLLGVDGGATKTVALVTDGAGEVLGSGRAGSSDIHAEGASAEAAISELDGIYLFDIDDLERVVASNLAERARAADDAMQILESELAEYHQRSRADHVGPTIRALRQHLDSIATAEADKLVEQLARRPHTPEQVAEGVRRMAQLMVAKMLHQPQVALRTSSADERDARVDTVRTLFALPDDEPETTPSAVEPSTPDPERSPA